MIRCWHSPRSGRRRCWPGRWSTAASGAASRAVGGSTSTCEVRMSPSSSSSDPFAFLVAAGPVAQLTSAPAWIETLLEVEAALARAQAEVGEIPGAAAVQIAGACDVDRFDVDAIVAEAALGGNLVIPLVPRLRDVVGPEVARFVHRAATSQDIVDTGTAVVVQRCARAVAAALGRTPHAVGAWEQTAGGAPMIARPLGQHAVPTTFARVTSRWRDGLTAAAGGLDRTARQAAWLGGPGGGGPSVRARHHAGNGGFA